MVGRGARGRPWLLGQIAAVLSGRRPPEAPTGSALAELICGQYEAMLAPLRPRPRGASGAQAPRLVPRPRSRRSRPARPTAGAERPCNGAWSCFGAPSSSTIGPQWTWRHERRWLRGALERNPLSRAGRGRDRHHRDGQSGHRELRRHVAAPDGRPAARQVPRRRQRRARRGQPGAAQWRIGGAVQRHGRLGRTAAAAAERPRHAAAGRQRRGADPDASPGHGREDGPQPRPSLRGAVRDRHGGDAGARNPQPARRHLRRGPAPRDDARRRRPRADRPHPGRGGADRQARRPGRAVRRPAPGPAQAAQHPRRPRPRPPRRPGRIRCPTRASARSSIPRCRPRPATPTSCCRSSRTCSRTPPKRSRASAGPSRSPPPSGPA